jgi:glycosyltransferase involved in cell wall biosynthesis
VKSCLIIFPDDWLSYSPTVLNLASMMLTRGWRVKIVTVQSGYPLSRFDAELSVVRIHRRLKRVLGWVRLFHVYRAVLLILRLLKEQRHDCHIAVDSHGALCMQLAGIRRFDYLSLEVHRDTAWKLVDRRRIRSVLIQSPERYEYLFGNAAMPRFIIQNAPMLTDPVRPRAQGTPFRLVFFGNAIAPHGIFDCIDLVCQDRDLSLEICGVVAADVRDHVARCGAAERIRVNADYVDQSHVQAYLAQFDAGLCLYNVSESDFNYQSIPSGKLFNYFSAALPVIASDLIGLKPVKDFGAGVLVKHHSVAELREAVSQIQRDYATYSKGAADAANHFEFRRMSQPYLDMAEQA